MSRIALALALALAAASGPAAARAPDDVDGAYAEALKRVRSEARRMQRRRASLFSLREFEGARRELDRLLDRRLAALGSPMPDADAHRRMAELFERAAPADADDLKGWYGGYLLRQPGDQPVCAYLHAAEDAAMARVAFVPSLRLQRCTSHPAAEAHDLAKHARPKDWSAATPSASGLRFSDLSSGHDFELRTLGSGRFILARSRKDADDGTAYAYFWSRLRFTTPRRPPEKANPPGRIAKLLEERAEAIAAIPDLGWVEMDQDAEGLDRVEIGVDDAALRSSARRAEILLRLERATPEIREYPFTFVPADSL